MECTKVEYAHRHLAKQALRRIRKNPKRRERGIYFCRHCKNYHLSSQK